jgi:uncharacterized radical SAM protein YgiQ
MPTSPKNIFSYRRYWAHRFGTAPVLPMSRQEMDELGWDSCDIILVTGDAYVDHPSFGMALIGRLLEAQGFRVGIIAQPDWRTVNSFQLLGRPNLFFGVTAGNMDSMVNRYTADRKIRSDDAYTPHGEAGQRPDRAVLVYSHRCREAYKEVPIVIGGIEASLRRIAHYDYWSETVRRSILVDSKADILLYGNAERALVTLAHRLAAGESITQLTDLRGTVLIRDKLPEGWNEIDATSVDTPRKTTSGIKEANLPETTYIRLPAFEQVKHDSILYAQASRLLHLESNPHNARALVQRHGNREVWLNSPPLPLTTAEMDKIYELPYTRQPHPAYQNAKIPAYEMIRFSITIMRGCFGGCTFCSLTEHEGRIIQNRSDTSILQEIETLRDTVPGFTGVISDLGGPTANMYRLHCDTPAVQATCRRLSCVYPKICKHLNTNHQPLIQLYQQARNVSGIKKVLIASGLRYDLAITSPEYVKELVTHHVGGYLKIAPEHTEREVLSKMMKPEIAVFDKFKALFEKFSQEAGKEQYLVPYFIAAHPGTTDEDMLNLALWLKRNDFRLDQVQVFLPSPMSLATAMYHTGKNPLQPIRRDSDTMFVPQGLKIRRLHKAFLRYHDPENWELLREALRQIGRSELIGNGKRHLVPAFRPDRF